MNLQNGYKVIYEKTADGVRTFYATKNVKCDPTVDDKIVEAAIGEYKLIYEKNGSFYGSKSGIPSEEDYCFTDFDKVFKKVDGDSTSNTVEPSAPADDETETNTTNAEPVSEPETEPETESDEPEVPVDETESE